MSEARLPVRTMTATAWTVPTDRPESDGTLAWDRTTMIVVEVECGDAHGVGYTYAPAAAAHLIRDHLLAAVEGRDAMDTEACWYAMLRALRNAGQPGLCSRAIAAADMALWDAKACALDQSLATLLGCARHDVPVYGSGGFTSYGDDEIRQQIEAWAGLGIRSFKIKVGRQPDADVGRAASARSAMPEETELFVDANGAYDRKQALAMAERFRDYGVTWFEEPVPSPDLHGLRLLRDRAPAPIEIAAGEYGCQLPYFRRMIEAGAVDVLQADATRCGGVSGFMKVAHVCEAFAVPLSAHTAPQVHAHLCCAASPVRHVEYFHDHARLEAMFFEGCLVPRDGSLRPDPVRPGLGIELKRQDAEKWKVFG